MTKYEPRLRNGLESPDYDEMLAAYLTLVDQHCLHLVPVPASSSVPAIPGHIDNRAVYNSWAGEYVVDYEAWVNNFPEAGVKVALLKYNIVKLRSRSGEGQMKVRKVRVKSESVNLKTLTKT